MSLKVFRNKVNRYLVLLVLFIAACSQKLEPQNQCNFVQNSELQRVSWKGQIPIALYISDSIPQDYHGAIRDAAAKWNYKLGSHVFDVRDNVSVPAAPNKDKISAIYWDLNWESDKAVEQARTTIYWKGSSIDEADIRINAHDFHYSVDDKTPLDKVDFESLMVHEMGHVLGLQHIEKGREPAKNNGRSVMEALLASGDSTRRSPSEYDIESLKCEY